MRQLLKTQVLDALKDCLSDLESLKLISGDDPEVALLKDNLHQTIIKIENDGAPEYEYQAAA